jgi:hypothetical protein
MLTRFSRELHRRAYVLQAPFPDTELDAAFAARPGKLVSRGTVIPRILIMTRESALVEAIATWLPCGPVKPAVDLEARDDGLRVKLTYLGVESGVLFAWDGWGTRDSVQRRLDRLFDTLSWRVLSPPARADGTAVARVST